MPNLVTPFKNQNILFIVAFLSVLTGFNTQAKPNFMRSLYMADKPNYKADEELSVVGEFGFLFTEGNSSASTLKARLNASQELKAWEYQIFTNLLYRKSTRTRRGERIKATTAHNFFVSGQADYKLDDPNNRIFVYGEYDEKRFSGFLYQAALAAGWSSKLWKNKKSQLRYSLGPGYSIAEAEETGNREDFNGLIVRAAMEYKRKFSDHATFRQFVSTEAEADFTKTRSETSMSTKLSGALGMKFSFMLNHDTGVAEGRNELDTQTALTLVYQFF